MLIDCLIIAFHVFIVVFYWHPGALQSRYPPINLDSNAGTYDLEVHRFRELCDTLVRSQDSKEKLCTCESVAHAEFYTTQVMVVHNYGSYI
jgi:hypothetical protein